MPYRDRAEQRQFQARWFQANKRRLVRRAIEKRLNFAREAKERPCADCGVSYPYYVMQFDHVRGVKKIGVSTAMRKRGMKAIQEEISKCEVVCANCHAERTWRRRLDQEPGEQPEEGGLAIGVLQ